MICADEEVQKAQSEMIAANFKLQEEHPEIAYRIAKAVAAAYNAGILTGMHLPR